MGIVKRADRTTSGFSHHNWLLASFHLNAIIWKYRKLFDSNSVCFLLFDSIRRSTLDYSFEFFALFGETFKNLTNLFTYIGSVSLSFGIRKKVRHKSDGRFYSRPELANRSHSPCARALAVAHHCRSWEIIAFAIDHISTRSPKWKDSQPHGNTSKKKNRRTQWKCSIDEIEPSKKRSYCNLFSLFI